MLLELTGRVDHLLVKVATCATAAHAPTAGLPTDTQRLLEESKSIPLRQELAPAATWPKVDEMIVSTEGEVVPLPARSLAENISTPSPINVRAAIHISPALSKAKSIG